MIHSKKYSVNYRDIIHGFVTAFIAASSAGLLTIISSGTLPTFDELKTHVVIGLSGGFAYLLKKFLSNSDNKILGKESENKLV